MLVGVCGLLLGAGFAPSATQAQAVGQRLKLGLEATLFEYADAEVTPDGSNTGASVKSTTFGVAPGMGFDIAYGVGRMIVLGARFGLSVTSVDLEGTESDVTELQLHPHPICVPTMRSARPCASRALTLPRTSDQTQWPSA